jgi:hypothetical protein
MLLLVDALDEAQTYTGVTLPHLLSRLNDLPTPVRILATTRDDPRILKLFPRSERLDLIGNANPAADDVRTYAERRLAKLDTIAEFKRQDFAAGSQRRPAASSCTRRWFSMSCSPALRETCQTWTFTRSQTD